MQKKSWIEDGVEGVFGGEAGVEHARVVEDEVLGEFLVAGMEVLFHLG